MPINLSLIETLIKTISITGIILSTFGIISNVFSIATCLRKELRKSPTFIFMFFISLIYILPLGTIVICPFFIHFEHIKINIELCKKTVFISLWACQSSAYLKVNLNDHFGELLLLLFIYYLFVACDFI